MAAMQHPEFSPSTAESISASPPQMPMATSLKLDRGNEDRLVNYALDRLGLCSGSYGLATQSSGWLAKRQRATAMWEGDYSHRESIPDSIWQKSNKSLKSLKRIGRMIIARCCDDLLGTSDPFFSLSHDLPAAAPDITPEQIVQLEEQLKQTLATVQSLEKWSHFKATQSEAREVLREAVKAAVIRGEAVVKRRHRKHDTIWWEYAEVAALRDGTVLKDRSGNKISRYEEFEPHPDMAGAKVLTRDKSVVLPPDVIWVGNERVKRTESQSQLELGVVWYEDFHCETTEEDIHRAEFIAQTTRLSLNALKDLLSQAVNRQEAQSILEQIRRFDTKLADNSSAPRAMKGEEDRAAEALPVASVAECYLTVDADGDGFAEEIVILVERKTRLPLFYDYLAKVMPDKRRPFEMEVLEQVEGRWYGTGIYEGHGDLDEFCDRMFNRIIIHGGAAGRIDCSNPRASRETEAGEPIQFGKGIVYTLNEGFNKEDLFSSILVPEMSDNARYLLDMCMQTLTMETGSMNAGEGALSSMPAGELATGIRSLERAGDILNTDREVDLKSGLERILDGFIRYCVAFMEPVEVMWYMERDAPRLLMLKQDDVRLLKVKARLLMNKSRTTEMIKLNGQALEAVLRYQSLPPHQQVTTRPMFVQILKALDVADVDAVLPIPDPELVMMSRQAAMSMWLPPPPDAAGSDGVPDDTSTPPPSA